MFFSWCYVSIFSYVLLLYSNIGKFKEAETISVFAYWLCLEKCFTSQPVQLSGVVWVGLLLNSSRKIADAWVYRIAPEAWVHRNLPGVEVNH